MISRKRILYFLLIFIILCLAAIIIFSGANKQSFGVTFSKQKALELNLNWKNVYLDILNDLKVKNIRLVVYWHQIEKEKNQYDFEDLDWMIEKAVAREANLIMVLGRKVPGWPECHIPYWAQNLTEGSQQKEILEFINDVVSRYKDIPNIKYWQIENEPFAYWFADCRSKKLEGETYTEKGVTYKTDYAEVKSDKDFLKEEIKTVRKLDPTRPVIITESGELSTWINGARYGDILGISIYRTVWNKYVGYLKYPLSPSFYKIKAFLIKYLFGVKDIFVVEAQSEPWTPTGDFLKTSLKEQLQFFDLAQFKKNINFVKKAGFGQNYFWGAEWWYWMKEKNNYPYFWEEFKKLISKEK